MKSPVMVLALGALFAGAACSSETPNTVNDTRNAGAGGAAGTVTGSAGRASTGGGAPVASGGSAGTAVAGAGASGSTTTGGAGSGGALSAGGGAGLPASGASSGGGAGARGGAGAGGVGGMTGGAGAGGGTSAFVYHYGADVENTTVDCTVAEPAEPSTLSKIQKLPDPFIKMDGTKISKRSDWHCRRQEILKQAEKYIYGERPAFDKVSGEVTASKITVHVEALSKSIDSRGTSATSRTSKTRRTARTRTSTRHPSRRASPSS